MEQNFSPAELEKKVIEVLKTVFDPEIPVNIYELGLVYDVKTTLKQEVVILMTLTAPTCPVAGSMPLEIEDKVKGIEGVANVKVIITFDPPWNKDMMSDAAKFELGFF
jgi:FeS assembly SUF system protein